MDRGCGPSLGIKWYLAIPTVPTELPPPGPQPAPTGPCTQRPGSGPPADSISLLGASGEGPPGSGVSTWQCLGCPYHLVFVFFLRLHSGPQHSQSCPFKQFILFIPRETVRKIKKIKSQKMLFLFRASVIGFEVIIQQVRSPPWNSSPIHVGLLTLLIPSLIYIQRDLLKLINQTKSLLCLNPLIASRCT